MTKFWNIALAALLSAVGAAPSSAATPVAKPVVKLSGRVSPSGRRLRPGTPVTFTLDSRFGTVPPGADLVLQRLVYLFPHGTVVNGRLFPSCPAALLARANGRLSACPTATSSPPASTSRPARVAWSAVCAAATSR